MKTTLISLQCQHIIRAFVPYFPSNVTLTAHGIKCDNRTLQIKQIQQFRDILDLVFLDSCNIPVKLLRIRSGLMRRRRLDRYRLGRNGSY